MPEHNHDHDFLKANRDYFDLNVHKYDDNEKTLALSRRLAKALLRSYPFDEDKTTVMDFACGTGPISRQLAPYVKSIVGVDVSPAMVDRYNQRTADQGIPYEEMHAVCAELQGEEEELHRARFDLIICCMAYHHFDSIDRYTKILSSFIRPGGSLIVTDFQVVQNQLADEKFSDIVAHPLGFTPAQIGDKFCRSRVKECLN